MSRSCDSFRATKVDGSMHYWNFQWTVNNFPSAPENIYSDQISFKENCPVKWRIIIEKPRNDYYSNKPTMCVGLQRLDGTPTIILVNATLFFKITNEIGDIYLAETTESTFSTSSNVSKCKSFDQPSQNNCVYGLNNRNFYLSGCSLILTGKIIVDQCCCQSPVVVMPISDNTKQLQFDLKQLWQNSEFVDVEIKVGLEIVHAHKVVLCARSPVFKKMFQNDMKEKACNSVEINDMEKSVVETFLEFLYTGNMEDRKLETVMALYSASDKYEVLTLQKTCREILVTLINHNTVSAIMKLADAHHDDSLKNTAVAYICRNFSQVESTTSWNDLIDSDPRLASFALKEVSLKILGK